MAPKRIQGNSPKTDRQQDTDNLRKRAEAQYHQNNAGEVSSLSDLDQKRLVQELQVHQIELEIQNEELIHTRTQLESVLSQFTDLYDFAPVGYFILDRSGKILSVNLNGATLLDTERARLVDGRFGVFISDHDRSDFNAFLSKVFKSQTKEVCEVTLRTECQPSQFSESVESDSRNCYIRIEATASEDGQTCRLIALDITERKQAAEAIRKSEERYRLLYERSPLPYQSLDADGKFIEVNDAWLQTLGYSREEVIGHWFGEFLLPETVDAFRQRFPRFKANGEIHNQVQMVHKDGYIIIIDIDGKIGRDAAGNFKQTHCVLHDVTEQQRLQDALRASEERYQTVADFTVDWETWIDPEGKYQYCSPSCEQITGYPPEKFIEAPEFLLSLVYADDREIVEDHFTEEKKDRQGSTFIYRIHRNNGQVRWIEHRCQPVFSKDGSFLGMRGSNRDVTHRKLAEKALLESEARYRRLANHAPDIIFRYDLNPTMKLAYINPAVQTITGYSPEECYVDPDLMLNMVHPDDRGQMNAMLVDLNVPEEGFTQRWVGKDGVTRWMESRIVPVWDEAGKLLAVEGITRDLSDRIKMGEDLAKSESLYRSLIENASNGVMIVQDGVYQYANPAALKLLGRDAAEIRGLPIAETIHPELLAIMKQRSEKVFIEGAPNPPVALKVLRPDGSVIISESTSIPVSFDGKPAAMVIGQDVTERIQAENALKTSEHFLARAQKIAKLGNWTRDLVTGISTWSDGLYAVYGREKHENDKGFKLWLDTVHPDDKERTIDIEKRFLADESVYDTEYRIIRQDNHEVRIIHATAELLRDDQGTPIQVVGVAQDITERVLSENALRISEQSLARSQKIARMGSWTLDFSTGKSTWSDGVYAIYGWEKQEGDDILEMWLDTVHPDDKERMNDLNEKFLSGQCDYDTEHRIIRHDNQEVRIVHSAAEIFRDDKGTPLQVIGFAQDVTERVAAENALRLSERYLARSQQIARMGSWSFDYKTSESIWSDGLYYIYGREKKENDFPSDMWLETIHTDDKERMNALDQKVFAGECDYDTEYRIVRQDNHEVRIIHAIAEIIRDDKGTPIRSIGVAQDITERKRAGAALRESEFRLRTLFEQAAVGVSLIETKTGRYIDINQKYCDFLGYTKTEMLNSTFQKISHPDDIEENVANIKLLMAGKISEFAIEKRLVRKDGEIVWINLTVSPLWVPGEEPDEYIHIAIVQDITERVNAEKALRESERVLSNAQQIAHLGSWDWNVATNETYWSDELFEIYGRDKEDGIPPVDSWQDVVHPEDRDDLNRHIEDALAGKSPYDIEYRIFREDNQEERTLHAIGEVVRNENGTPIRLTGAVQDITEKKRSQETLRRSELDLRKAQEVANVGSWKWHIPTNQLEWSDQMYRIFDVDKAAVSGNLADVMQRSIHPDDIAAVEASNLSVINHHKPIPLEYRIIWPDGSQHVVWEEAGELILDDEGKPLILSGIVQDITERKKAEDALKESELRFRTLFEHAAVGVALIDTKSGRYIDINQKYCDFVGYSKTEMLNFAFSNVTYPQDREENIEKIKLLLAGEIREFAIEKRYVHKDGTIVWGALTVSPLWAPGEIPNEYIHIAIVQDITERKQVEEALRKSEASLSQAQKIANVGSWSWHLPSDQYEGSDQFYTIYGIDRDESSCIWHKIVSQSVHPDDIPLIEAADKIVMSGSIPKPVEYRVVWPDGSIHIVSDEAGEIILDEDGKPSIVTGIVQDITERKQMTLALQKERNLLAQRVNERTAELSQTNAELMKALQTKDEFLANMSHELRTPLTSILGISEILNIGLRGDLNEEQHNSIRTIQESGEHLLALINDILDFSKSEAGKLEIEPDFVVVDDICQASLSLVKELAQRKDLSLNYNLSDPQLRLWADGRRLKQIVVNLLSNAVKFTPEGGEISLDVDLDRKQGRVRFVVQDNGIGISQADIGKLFQPFTQLDSRLSRQYEGSGLGLALVRRLVDLHQGEVFVESEGISGKGSRFTVMLPWQENLGAQSMPTEETSKAASSDLTKTGALRERARNKEIVVLLAEDNPTNSLTISEYLQVFGYRTIHAQDGREAVEIARVSFPDIILMDVQMPVMNGLEAIRLLRQDPRFKKTPILALTALAMPGDRERCLAVGANEYLTKPIRMKDLLDKMKANLNIQG